MAKTDKEVVTGSSRCPGSPLGEALASLWRNAHVVFRVCLALMSLVILVLVDTTPDAGVVYAILPVLAAGGLAALQAGIAAGESRRASRDQRETSMKLAKYQWSKDLEMWNLANAYNTPQSQMQRFKDAGLNPNLIYGQGNSGNAAQAMPKFQAPTLRYDYPVPDFVGAMTAFQDIRIKQAQIDNLKEQNKVIETKALADRYMYDYGLSAKTMSLQERYKQDVIKTDLSKGILPYQLEFAAGKNRQQTEAIRKLVAETRYKDLQSDWYVGDILSKMGANLVRMMPGRTGKNLGRGIPRSTSMSQGNFNRTTRDVSRGKLPIYMRETFPKGYKY